MTSPHRPINPALTAILDHFYSMFEFPGPYKKVNQMLSSPYLSEKDSSVSARLANVVDEEYWLGFKVVGFKSWIDKAGQEWIQAVRQ